MIENFLIGHYNTWENKSLLSWELTDFLNPTLGKEKKKSHMTII